MATLYPSQEALERDQRDTYEWYFRRAMFPTVFATQSGAVLDVLGISATAAFSLRLLRNGYTGSAANIRRSSDSATKDIGFVNGNFDVSTFSAFIGGGTGAIAKWYDQSGSGNDAVQATALNQPSLNATGINGKAAASFDGSNGWLTLTNTLFSAYTAMALAGVIKSSDTGTRFVIGKNDGASEFGQILANSGSNVMANFTNAASADVGVTLGTTAAIMNGSAHTLGVNWDGTTLTPVLDGVAGTTAALASPLKTDATVTVLGSRVSHDLKFSGLMAEMLFFTASLSGGSRAALQASQKAYWATA